MALLICCSVVSVLKMVKLFGWENKMLKQVEAARNEELKAVLKLKILQSLIGILKYDSHSFLMGSR